jgi:hypothetical protein
MVDVAPMQVFNDTNQLKSHHTSPPPSYAVSDPTDHPFATFFDLLHSGHGEFTHGMDQLGKTGFIRD